ncbi:general secretion pathway protein GspN [Bradyrhizobium sp. ORS 375]|uniref:general secretion pathway protein GspN n=1 Tax=Bradyrhizobium sp. (strain ORS 375) TaxID=566679 RepID=UPI0002E075C8|nr:general secretion pathway protein GspN [Bradyrhizobium sp. ORS 375]
MRLLLCIVAIAGVVGVFGSARGEDIEGLEPAARQATPSLDPPVVNSVSPAAKLPARPAGSSANPIWDVPIAALSATRDRPIFSASRRPPEPPVAEPVMVTRAPPAPPSEPDRPSLQLVGTVVGDEDSFGIFIESSSQTSLRLRIGAAHDGWLLQSLKSRQAVLQKDTETIILMMPQQGATADNEADVPPAPTVSRERMARRSR